MLQKLPPGQPQAHELARLRLDPVQLEHPFRNIPSDDGSVTLHLGPSGCPGRPCAFPSWHYDAVGPRGSTSAPAAGTSESEGVHSILFALFAEVERDLISERTREGLAKARASGRKLGRPKGSLGVSRLDGREDEIRHFLELGVSKTAIAKITGVSRTTLYSFMTTRGLRLSR